MKRTKQVPRLSQQVAGELRRYIAAHCKSGDALPPVRELMVDLGISHSTLRAAQSLLAQEGYLDIRHGSGVYVSERALTRRIGIYSELDLLQPRMSTYHREVMRGLRRYFQERGVRADVYLGEAMIGHEQPDRPTANRFMEDVEAGRLDGVVFTEVPITEQWLKWTAGFTLPSVGGWWTPYRFQMPQDTMKVGVETLIGQGCRHLALLAWGHSADEFEQCMSEHGLEYRPGWARHDLEPSLAGAGWQEFREIWSAYPAKPDGLLILDDVLAEDAAKAIAELRIQVPEQLRVVAHANKGGEWGFPFPATRLEVDPAEAAEALGAMMLDLLDGKTIAQPGRILTVKLVAEEERVGGFGTRLGIPAETAGSRTFGEIKMGQG